MDIDKVIKDLEKMPTDIQIEFYEKLKKSNVSKSRHTKAAVFDEIAESKGFLVVGDIRTIGTNLADIMTGNFEYRGKKVYKRNYMPFNDELYETYESILSEYLDFVKKYSIGKSSDGYYGRSPARHPNVPRLYFMDEKKEYDRLISKKAEE